MAWNKILLCDLDNTFYDYDTANNAASSMVASSLAAILMKGPREVEDAISAWRDRTHHDLHGQAASHARGIYYHHALEKLTWRSQPALAVQHERLFWDTFLDNMQLYEWAQEYLEELLHDWWRLGIITNLTQAIQFEKLSRLGIEKYFEFVVTSEEAWIEKPDPRIFTHLMRKFVPEGELDMTTFYMMGDSESSDVEWARGVGITDKNILFKKKEGPLIITGTGITEFSNFNDL